MTERQYAKQGSIAAIYCRVSSVKQTTQGDGLRSQETRCREYAGHRGYNVVEVFTYDMSGGVAERPGMKRMLNWLDANRDLNPVVIIDDVSRLARGLDAHIALRTSIGGAGGKLESPSIEFGEDSDSMLVENLMASVSQHQRQKNAEQTRNRMRSRVMNGFWPFKAPKGYRYEKSSSGKVLVRDEPLASIIQEALEGFARGRFGSQAEVKRFLEAHPLYPKDLDGHWIRAQRITELLTQPLYAGLVSKPEWSIDERPGQHAGLISIGTYERIKERLQRPSKHKVRKDISEDFPVRGAVHCADCSKPLSSCWSKSRTGKKHPYYFCYNRKCESYRKSIRKDDVESAVTQALQSVTPHKPVLALARAMLKDIWDSRIKGAQEALKQAEARIRELDQQVATLLDRIVVASNPRVIQAYEQKIDALEREKRMIGEKARHQSAPKHSFEELFELASEILSNPYEIWRKGSLSLRKMVLKMVFPNGIEYDKETGVRTTDLSLPFKVLESMKMGKCEMARPRGFEPLAFGSGNQRSIRLS